MKTKYFGKNTPLLLFIPLILSAFINTWNLTGFPSLHVDEGYYMWKTMSTLQTQDLQPTNSYFAPYFGQIFMASILRFIGYPDTLNPNLDAISIESLYLIPRLIMSILAIVYTFLIFKITEKRYGIKVAFIAAVLFVVMPYGWLLKRIFLETIQLPLLLTSVLLVLYLKKDLYIPISKSLITKYTVYTFNNDTNGEHNYAKWCRTKPLRSEIKNISLILFSGTFLGLAIFTKIPIVAMIPLIAYLVFTNSNNNRFKNLAIWFIPVILIPLIWPVHAYSIGEFDKWIEDVLYQTQRESKPLINTLTTYFENDLIMFLLGFAGIIYAVIKRDYFILLFSIPFLLFLYWIDYVSAFHVIPLFPVFAIVSSKMIVELSDLLPNLKIRNSLPYITLSVIAIFCLISVFLLISIDTNSLIFQTQVELIHYLQKTNGSVTLVGSALYLWIPHYIFDLSYNTTSYDSNKPLQTDKFILIADPRYQKIIKENTSRGIFHNELFSQTKLVETVKLEHPVKKYNIKVYPYTNLRQSSLTKNIEIRSNY